MAVRTSFFPPTQVCCHCGARTPNWLWRLVEPGPRTYEIACADCAKAQDADFTDDACIEAAMSIVHDALRPISIIRKRGVR